MTSVQAVYFTSRSRDWHRFAQCLGLDPLLPLDPAWSEFRGAGVLAIHHADPGGPAAGTTRLQLLVDRLDDVATRWHAANVAMERSTLAGVGDVITARLTGSAEVSAIAGAGHHPVPALSR